MPMLHQIQRKTTFSHQDQSIQGDQRAQTTEIRFASADTDQMSPNGWRNPGQQETIMPSTAVDRQESPNASAVSRVA